MKYLLLILVLGLGYEGYTNWSDLRSKYTEIYSRVVSATAAAKAQTGAASGGPITIPGQVAPGVWQAAVATSASGALSVRVAESQKQAVAKYPALSVVNSEMNSRFVFRYKRMLAEKSPRLQDPTWPMQLADECNEAVVASKPKAKTPSTDKPRQTGSLASTGQPTAH